MLLPQPGPPGVATALRPPAAPARDIRLWRDRGSLESVATVTLGENARLGFLILAHHDPERFNCGQHVDLLRLLGEVVAAALIGTGATGIAGTCSQAKAVER